MECPFSADMAVKLREEGSEGAPLTVKDIEVDIRRKSVKRDDKAKEAMAAKRSARTTARRSGNFRGRRRFKK